MNADHKTRATTLEAARRGLEDAFLVMTHLETKQSNVIRQMAEEQAESDRRHRDRMAEFDDKLIALRPEAS